MKVTLAVCTNRGIRPKTLGSLLEMVNYSKIDWHIVIAEKGYTVAENRNYSVVQAQKNASDYLLFIDDDMTFPKETFERLLSLQKEIVGVASYSRILPLAPTVGLMNEKGEYKHPDKYPEWEMRIPSEPFQAYFVGGGVLLIKMSIFEKLEKPYFAFETYEEGELKGMVSNGEDGVFCREAHKKGIEVWCDPLPIGHLGEMEFSKQTDEKLKNIYGPSL